MPTDETNDLNAVSEELTHRAADAVGGIPAKGGLNRRTFLKAAALGAAAAALINKDGERLRLGPSLTLAHNASSVNCRANEVRIPTAGRILNEPCNCTGTFNAEVEFEVFNNTGTNRYCLTLHLCPVTLPNGTVFNPGDIILNNGGPVGPGTSFLRATIPNYPCGASTLCFGTLVEDGRTRCPSDCCTVISWEPNAPQGGAACPTNVDPVPSKCRLQQICIVGRGQTTLDCDVTATGEQETCAVPCGETTTLRLCTTNPASLGPFTYALSDGQTFGPTSDTCHNFTVGPITQNTTFTGTIADKEGCAKSDSVTLTTTPITIGAPTVVSSPCSGIVTCEAGAVSGGSGTPSFSFKLDNGSFVPGVGTNGNQFVYNPTVGASGLDTACHSLVVKVVRGACEATSPALTFSQCVQTATGCTP